MGGKIFLCSNVVPVSAEPVKNGAVAVEKGKIKAAGSADEIKNIFPNFAVRNLGSGVVLPGFINCHVHLELGWLRPEKHFENFTSWLSYIISRKSAGARPGEIEKSVKDGIEILTRSGVTTVGEISSYGKDCELLKKSPLRTVLFREITDSKPDLKRTLEKSGRFEERFFPHAPYSCSPELISRIFKMCRETGSPTGIHLAESPEETDFVKGKKNGIEEKIYKITGKPQMQRHKAPTPLKYLLEIDCRKTKITAVHMVHIKEKEIEKIYETDMGVILCPRSNYFLNTGDAPALLYAEKLQRLGLGTDGLSSNTTLNFFDEIKSLYKILLPLGKKKAAEKTVRTATLGGAEALFLEKNTGSIEPGKDADLIFIKSGNTADPYLSIVEADKAEVLT